MPRPLFTPGKDPVPTVRETGWAPGPVWTGAENLASTGIRSPGRPAHSFLELGNILETANTRILLQKAEQWDVTWCKVGDVRWVFETLPSILLQKLCRLVVCVATWHQVTSVFRPFDEASW